MYDAEAKRAELLATIVQFWPSPTASPASGDLATMTGDPELASFVRDTEGKSWVDIPCEVVERHYSVLPSLNSLLYSFYLPCFIACALKRIGSESNILPFLVYSLCPAKWDEYSEARYQYLSPAQKKIIAEFLILVGRTYPSDMVAADATNAIELFWKKFLVAH